MRAYVLSVTHKVCMRQVVRLRARQCSPLDEVPDGSVLPDQAAIVSQNRDHLMSAIRGLPIIQRQCLTLALEDLSHREIANTLGISENAVAIRIHRARKHLRSSLGSKNG
jgi:RNA polymerase sigma factor (sigma-70 family)